MCWSQGNQKEEPVLWVAYGNGSIVAWRIAAESGVSCFKRELTYVAENSISHISWHCGSDPNSGNGIGHDIVILY